MKDIDVLLLARPDHSYAIYQALSNQSKLKFLYGTFGLFDKKLSFLKYKKARYVDGNARIFKWFTVLHTLCYKLGWIKGFDEAKLFTKYSRNILKKYQPKIIHYWPNFCYEAIDEYKLSYPGVTTIAEVYMPNPIFACRIMKDVYAKYGMEFNNKYLVKYAQVVSKRFAGADYIAVPSKFVEDTFKQMLPNKKFVCTSYGFNMAEGYKRRITPQCVKNFVYVGQVSLEKGVDLLLKFFSKRPDLRIDLFGNITSTQKHILLSPYEQCDNIIFHGAVSKAELREAFKKADVGLHMSRYDAYSLAVAEEIGSGLPVIVSENTGNAFDVEKYGVGLVAKIDDDSADFTNCMEQICNIETYSHLLENVHNALSSTEKPLGYTDQLVNTYCNLLNNEGA